MSDEIRRVLAGQEVEGVRVIWDSQDANNEGAFVRYDDGRADEPVEFVEWSNGESVYGGVHVSEYFDGDGAYLGPDQDGIYPVLV